MKTFYAQLNNLWITLILAVIVSLFFISCEENVPEPIYEPETPSSLDVLTVPESFNWNTMKSIAYTLTAHSKHPGLKSRISIFKGSPMDNGVLVVSSVVDNDIPFSTNLEIPTYQEGLYVECTFPSGNKISKAVELSSGRFEATFNENEIQNKQGSLIGQDPVDSDEDGVPDNIDAKPNNRNVATIGITPSGSGPATLLFEDNWPHKGDYDFNDLVVEISSIYAENSNNRLVYARLMIDVQAAGAFFDNGLGVYVENIDVAMLDVVSKIDGLSQTTLATLSDIEDFDLPPLPDFSIQDPGGILENQGSKLVILAVDEIDQVFPLHTDNDPWAINTIKGGYTEESKKVEIDFWFINNPVTNNIKFEPDVVDQQPNSNENQITSFNFFLIKNGMRGTEIHTSNRIPTDFMNTTLFGSGDDGTDIANAVYYKTRESNLPWGILVGEPLPFGYPVEYKSILEAYPKFEDWANSGGESEKDWYESTVPENIY